VTKWGAVWTVDSGNKRICDKAEEEEEEEEEEDVDDEYHE